MASGPGNNDLGPEAKAGIGEDAQVEEEDGDFGGVVDDDIEKLRGIVELDLIRKT